MDKTEEKEYVPDAGDIVWLHFDPQAGREQAWHRPRPTALVISPRIYNSRTSLMLCCPITTKIKGYPFEVKIAGPKANAVLSDQIKSLNWKIRKAMFKVTVSTE
ncbi:MAG: endoribonuclease MazF [Commensalibacter sp.]